MDDALSELAAAAWDFAVSAFLLSTLTGALIHAAYSLGLQSILQRIWVRRWLARRISTAIKYVRRHFDQLERENEFADWSDAYRPDRIGVEHTYGSKSARYWPYIRLLDYLDIRPSRKGKPSLRQSLRRLYYDMYSRRQAVNRIEDDILNFIGDSATTSLYSLSYSQLCGQISGALRETIEYPHRRILLYVFASSASPKDLLHIEEGPRSYERTLEEASEERQRVLYHGERGIDGLQAFLNRRWQKIEYTMSFIVSFVLVLVLLAISERLVLSIQFNVTYITIAFAAGLLAPLSQRVLDLLFSRE